MKSMTSRTTIAAALCAITMTALSATPVDAGGAVTTSLFLPLQGTVLNPNSPCQEAVPLSGMVHVVSILQPVPPPISQTPSPPPVKLHFNMAGVRGRAGAATPMSPPVRRRC